MVNQDLLNMLQVLKKYNPKLKFILCGDYRQLPPIDENRNKETDVFNHPIVLYLSHNNRIELTERKQYDKPLWNYLERGYEQHDWSGLPTYNILAKDLISNRALCYYNKARKEVNMWAIKNLKPDDGELLKNDCKDNEKADDIYLYINLTVMSITNNKDLNLINSDEYTVTDINENSIFLVQNGDDYNPLEINKHDFHKYFVANYIATVQKSQGATYKNNLYIFDTAQMMRDKKNIYTAVSRGTALDKIFIGSITV